MTAPGWATAWTIARRDLRARFAGLRLLLACLFLGTLALAAIGTLTGAITKELASRGQVLLGGDIEVAVYAREAAPDELAAMRALGTVSAGQRLQAMAVPARDAGLAVPVELKSVDGAWPLYGQLKLAGGRVGQAPRGMAAWIAPGVADRLGIGVGDRFRVGGAGLTVAGIIADEPDRLGEGFTLGPVVIVSREALARSGLVQPGAMVRAKYRIRLPAGADASAAAETLKRGFPDAGWELRDRSKATPGLDRFVSRMGQFLELVALAALAIAGIGIGNGVSSYLAARRASIATLKILGATSRDIARIYALEIGAAALLAIAAGLAAGVAVTPLIGAALGTLLPVAPGLVFDPAALAAAAAYGLLIAAVFAAPPLLRARSVPAMALMRARVSPLAGQWRALALPVGGGLAAIAALALARAAQPLLAAGFLLGAAVLFGLMALLGSGVRALAARLPRPRRPLLRLALANLHRPGAQTGALVTALGFGLASFVLLAGVQTSLDANIAQRVPQRAPDYFVLDLPPASAAEFTRIVRAAAPAARVRTVPALRGAILAYGPPDRMIRVADMASIPDDAWPLRGERGLTYSSAIPEGNVVTAGKWWPAGYGGPPLVSIDEKLAEALNLKLGERLTIGLLGVERSATIASFRRIDWDSMGFNYVLVFSPNAIADAPHNLAATINLDGPADKRALLSGLVRALPSSSVIEVGPVVGRARDILSQMGSAILTAASVAILAGLAVLVGALAAARASRLYDNVILRVLGASRRQLLGLQLAEYGLLAVLLGGVALVLGITGAWLIVERLFEFDWLPDWPRILAVLGGGIAVVLGFALAGSLPLLRARPAQALREL
ncbi:ABC transporter permease [Novosphingobium tardum]|uniref:ABC transporter permease n=1 Tax=Novosphingobium tardum TaxID=1538021 RepID=A0ABV8RQ11_9SPHN